MNDRERAMAMERMIHAHGSELLRLCLLLLGDRASAEDALQDTFVKAWRGLDGFRGDANERTWLTRIAVNTCRDLRRSKWFAHIDRKANLDGLPEPAVAFEPPDDVVTRAILSLPDGQRQIITLRYYQGLTAQEIAGVMKISRRTVHYRLEKAECTLKHGLEEWYYDR